MTANTQDIEQQGPQRFSIAWGIVFSTAALALIFVLLAHWDVHPYVLELFAWLDGIGMWGPVLFILIYMLIVVFVLPGILFTMGAGFLFGVVKGSIYVVLANTLGATVAFLIARHFLSKRASQYLLRQPRLKVLNDKFMPKGWKIVLVTRMVPFFPFKLSNYFFGLTRISLKGFVIGHMIGCWPLTINIVYVGSMAADLATLGTPEAIVRSRFEWVIYSVGFVVAAAMGIYLAWRAKRVLEKHPSDDAVP
jgi:uncharacterized membrane protein YdjX (TVP38/TMEM64 family)